jgi:hypothetical protein
MISMLPKLHPLAKTAIEARRAMNRLEVYESQNPNDPMVKDGTVKTIADKLRDVRNCIPEELKDIDVQGVQ